MARVLSPLFSLAAAGTIAGLVVYRMQRGRPSVQRTPTVSRPATERQRVHRNTFAAASAAWRALDATNRADWSAYAVTIGDQPRRVWLAEWIIQGATATNPPRLPATGTVPE